jgi:hypothetical protein
MISKTSAEYIRCIYCSKLAVEGSEPPLCEDHLKLVKEGAEQAKQAESTTIRDLDRLQQLHNPKETE